MPSFYSDREFWFDIESYSYVKHSKIEMNSWIVSALFTFSGRNTSLLAQGLLNFSNDPNTPIYVQAQPQNLAACANTLENLFDRKFSNGLA